jgi:hypothetical protein
MCARVCEGGLFRFGGSCTHTHPRARAARAQRCKRARQRQAGGARVWGAATVLAPPARPPACARARARACVCVYVSLRPLLYDPFFPSKRGAPPARPSYVTHPRTHTLAHPVFANWRPSPPPQEQQQRANSQQQDKSVRRGRPHHTHPSFALPPPPLPPRDTPHTTTPFSPRRAHPFPLLKKPSLAPRAAAASTQKSKGRGQQSRTHPSTRARNSTDTHAACVVGWGLCVAAPLLLLLPRSMPCQIVLFSRKSHQNSFPLLRS